MSEAGRESVVLFVLSVTVVDWPVANGNVLSYQNHITSSWLFLELPFYHKEVFSISLYFFLNTWHIEAKKSFFFYDQLSHLL